MVIHDRETLSALKEYQERNGRFFGTNDDFVDSLRIAVYALTRTVVHSDPLKANREWDDWSSEDWDRYVKGARTYRRIF